jgi:hypothetical protein
MQHVVIGPLQRIWRNLQQRRVFAREVPTQEALGPRIIEQVRQAVEPPVGHLRIQGPRAGLTPAQGTAGRVQGGQEGDLVGLTVFVNAIQRQRIPLGAHGASRGVGRAPCLAQRNDLRPQRLHGAHQRGAADPETREQVARGLSTPGPQGMKERVGV